MKYILAIDLGTTNIKSILFDFNGNNIRQSSFNLTTLNPAPNCTEQNPKEILSGTFKTIRELNAAVSDLECVVLSGAMHSLFPVDKNGEALSNAILWSDLRSSEIAKTLKSTPSGIELHHETGTPIHPMSPLCKLIWLRENLAELFNRTYKFISLKEYLTYHLTGNYVIDQSIASATGLMDLRKKSWSQQALKVAGIKPHQLSDLQPPTFSLPVINKVLNGVPLILGGGDGCLANLGSGIIDNSRVALTIGTSAAIRTTLHNPTVDLQRRTFCYYVDEGHYVSGGAMNNGGNIFQWLKQKYNVNEKDIFSSPPGSNGLITLPYVFGERAPFWETGMSPKTIGLKASHHTNDVARSYIEGICFNLKLISQSLGDFESITASGGFTKSKFWPQMVADIFNKPVHILQTGENSALGAAFIAMKSLGHIQDYGQVMRFIETSQTYNPMEDRLIVYEKSFERFTQLATSRY